MNGFVLVLLSVNLSEDVDSVGISRSVINVGICGSKNDETPLQDGVSSLAGNDYGQVLPLCGWTRCSCLD
jgi:hypothetical protein